MSATYPDAVPVPHAGARPPTSVATTWRTTTTRRKLQLALGLLWLVDAALQYQPYMFSRAFVTNTIEPTADGAPWIVAQPTLWAAHFMIHHITFYNSIFASVQILVALAIFYRPLLKLGLVLSVVWGLGVWWLSEGIGGIFNNASPLMGAPGAVLLYVFIALFVWPRSDSDDTEGMSTAERGALGATASKLIWPALWIGLALLGLESANRAPSAIHDMIAGTEPGEPGWIKAIDRALAWVAADHGTEISIIVAILFVVTAVLVFNRRTAKLAVILGVLLGIIIWLVENLGTVATGFGTDVNTGLPLVLLSVCFWPHAAAKNEGAPQLSSASQTQPSWRAAVPETRSDRGPARNGREGARILQRASGPG